MSQENVELARTSILGWNARGVDALIEHLDPEVEFHAPRESMNPGVYHGPAGVRDYFDRLAEVMSEQRVESIDLIDVDDERVIAVVQMFGRTPHFDHEIEANWAWPISVRDGKATRIETFTDKAQALEAAGLTK
jgi:ketosteroid isomerase-like protein